jgi:dTMP kinase
MILKKGFLVAFEGIDGSGKTTQAKLLYEYLAQKGLKVVLSKEPTDSIYGQKIKKLAQGERDLTKPLDEYLLFINDRKIHVENLIKPALQEKKIVILDRYYFSTIAYQGALGLDTRKIKEENESFSPIPEIVFLLNVPPRVGIIRIQKGREEKPNLFEQEEYLSEVSKVFNGLNEDYIVTLDGVDGVDINHNKIVNVIDDIVKHYSTKQEQYSLSCTNRKAC